MKMQRVRAFKLGTLLGLTLVAAALLALPARADTFSVFADLPVAFSLHVKNESSLGTSSETKDASSVSGYKVGITLPFFVGLAYESYEGKFGSGNAIGNPFKYDVTMYDLFLNLPLPVINIALGAGAGTGHLPNPPAGVTVKDGDLTQWFASLGINILPMVDLHVGYSSLSGTNKYSAPGVNGNLKSDGNMTSLGIKLGF